MNRRLGLGIAALLSLALGACGGGGDPATVASTATFQLRQAWVNSVTTATTQPFSVKGTYAGASVSGTGTANFGAAVPATFEGDTSALGSTSVVTGTLTQPNLQTIQYASSSTVYVDSNYVPLGMAGQGEYLVATATTPIPATAKVGDAGTLGTFTRYSDSTKSTVEGTRTIAWALQADTPTTAILTFVSTDASAGAAPTVTDALQARITPDGAFTRVSEQVSLSAAGTSTSGTGSSSGTSSGGTSSAPTIPATFLTFQYY